MWYSKDRLNRMGHTWWLLLLIFLFSSLLFVSSSQTSADSNGLVEIVRDVGYVEFAAHGIGTRGNPDTDVGAGEGTFAVLIEKEMVAVQQAHLIWTGRSEDYGQPDIYDDNGVMLSINGSTPVNITADLQFKQDPWFKGTRGEVVQLHESSDITSLIADLIPPSGSYTGDIIFSVTDQEHGTSAIGKRPDYDLNYGVGAWIVYEYTGSPGELYSEVIMYEGQDSFFRLWTPPRGPHSDVQCVSFPSVDYDREVETTHLVSGVDLRADVGGMRSSAFWYLTGEGTKPTFASPVPGIINAPGAIGFRPRDGQYALHSSAGLEWDNFEPKNFVTVPAFHTWICFQIESGDSQDLAGLGNAHYPASGMWNFFGIRMPSSVPPPPPTAVTLTSFDGRHRGGLIAEISWRSAEEINNFGYNLYRGSTTLFSDAGLIHFEPTAVSGGTGPGTQYQYIDTVPNYGTWLYWLEDVDTEGTKTLHGPVAVHVSRTKTLFLPRIIR